MRRGKPVQRGIVAITDVYQENLVIALPFGSEEIGYRGFYESLSDLRELFHSTGRFDDSNAKLDEIAKLLATYLAYKNEQIDRFPLDTNNLEALVSELQDAFRKVALHPAYANDGNTSIFGPNPSLSLRPGDGVIVRKIVSLVRYSIDTAFANRGMARPFDIVNEAFGHFVRENFRGNIEDAQYMTPPEVVEFMVGIALDDLVRDNATLKSPLVVADPSCGVGSFLAAFHHNYSRRGLATPLQLYGQDKVERMVRLSKINLELFGSQRGVITIGNSLFPGSPLDALNGKVDLILTNPPFGARFDSADIKECHGNLSIFTNARLTGRSLDSELLFIDRSLSLLKDGGRLLIVVPDSVVSASGPASIVRQYIRAHAALRAIIELPSVTFAQAGTRTRTVVLCVEKTGSSSARPVFFAKSVSVGFHVKSRKGVQVKISNGENDLLRIRSAYSEQPDPRTEDIQVISEDPSVVRVPYARALAGSWTPNHYHSDRILALEQLKTGKNFAPTRLGDLVDFVTDARRSRRHARGICFIGVLHVLSEGVLDMRGIRGYAPRTPGLPAKPGEVLLAKINPRIPRIVVVPDVFDEILCSAEFEVMRPKEGVDPYLVAFLLHSEYTQRQIRSLTSGTSASHNRVKTRDLADVLLPTPDEASNAARKMRNAVTKYRKSITAIANAYLSLAEVECERSAEVG
jgi:type I restriction-modification system DNA methylase subunit